MFYKNFVSTKDMIYGQNNESMARTLFTEKMKKKVQLARLYIDEEFGFFGASPNGMSLSFLH